LAGFRHPRYPVNGTAVRLREVFAVPRGLFEAADAVGDRIAVLPVLYHLLWRQELLMDVAAELLGGHSLVRVREGGR
jgi:hypothetical protein